jgi:hypothetical protein
LDSKSAAVLATSLADALAELHDSNGAFSDVSGATVETWTPASS